MASSIFLSYSHNDKKFVSRLSNDLKRAGAQVWLDEKEIELGDSVVSKIQQGISKAEYLGVVLSPNSVNSPWVEREVNMALTEEIGCKKVKVLPILYKECPIPGFLKDKHYADFTDESKYLDALEEIYRKLNVKNKITIAESYIKTCAEKMGCQYEKVAEKASIHGILKLSKDPFDHIGIYIVTGSKEIQTHGNKRKFVIAVLNKDNVLNWKILKLPVIVLYVDIDKNRKPWRAFWGSYKRVNQRTGILKIPKKTVFGSKTTFSRLEEITHEHAGLPDITRLRENIFLPKKVSEIKKNAWEFYKGWRKRGSVSPIFGEVQITLKAWRHITRVSTPQKQVIHKLSLLPLAEELIRNAERSQCVRQLNDENERSKVEFHAIRGLSSMDYQANILVEVILEVEIIYGSVSRVIFRSVHENRNWYQ